ncbi:CPBP family intramembrane glutamic endopeptidase [Catenuloplanes atrovinosus]|uniref:Membrane protease YdiL (CAAX protease family) n=1 Tax=Catenuloplanes atrovinosus TaxID=137266 RepID=A0AAE3YSN4_9ACTN|nr:type II CAAX endopeptidase family protein [Catenuloplanes atrovinosus]MDR7279233.1 membrane protease YdiL (CAAX protease family) [Catenuloplanes atrovinosus]
MMETLRTLVRRHPVVSFFSLAFGVSWLFWMPYLLSNHGLGLEPEIRFPDDPGIAQLLGVLPGAYLGPLGAAFTVTALSEGRAGLRRWVHRLTHWRVGWRWFFAVLLIVPAAILLAPLALPKTWGTMTMPGLLILLAYVPMLIMQIITTAAAEEPGWRDFALPRLQERFGPLFGTTILGLLWGAWHLPLFLTEWGGPDKTWWLPVVFIAGCVPLSLVMTWVFNRTGQSVPLIMLLHAGINSTYSLLWPEVFPTLDFTVDTLWGQLIASTAAALVLIIATRGRLGLRTPSHPTEPARATPAHAA